MNSRNKILNDLTVIKGIGTARQEWLRNRLGIRTYQNLIDLPQAEIISKLKSDGQIVSRAEVEMWVAQARSLAVAEAPVNPGEWEPFASFVVEFQVRQEKNSSKEYCTVAQHMESDVEQKWLGIELELLCRWMRERVEKRVVKVETRRTSYASRPDPVHCCESDLGFPTSPC